MDYYADIDGLSLMYQVIVYQVIVYQVIVYHVIVYYIILCFGQGNIYLGRLHESRIYFVRVDVVSGCI